MVRKRYSRGKKQLLKNAILAAWQSTGSVPYSDDLVAHQFNLAHPDDPTTVKMVRYYRGKCLKLKYFERKATKLKRQAEQGTGDISFSMIILEAETLVNKIKALRDRAQTLASL